MAKKTANGKRPAPLFETLEPRLLLSAEGLGAVVADAGLHDDLELPQGGAEIALLQVDDSAQAERAAVSQSRELVIVDPRTPDYQTLVDDLLSQTGQGRNIDVVVLDPTRDGVEQVSDALAGYQGLDAVHIVSHGEAGAVQLGGGLLGFDALVANAQAIQGWGAALDAEADILIYGCDLAATGEGRALVDSLGRLTGADVAASDDLTGAASRGGDWDLEYAAGEVETAIVFDAQVQETWMGLLANELWITEKSSLPVEEFAPTTLEPVGGVTSGSFAAGFDIQNFTGAGKEVWATHYVTQSVTIGTGTTFTVQQGDLLLSMEGAASLDGTGAADISVNKGDVFVFRPDSAGDYSAGEFHMLLEGLGGSNELLGLSLVEQDITVGGQFLAEGSFLYSNKNGSGNKQVQNITVTDAGATTTLGAPTLFLDGLAAGVSIGQEITGVQLVQSALTLGNTNLTAGQLLMSLASTDDVGNNGVTAQKTDIFMLDITSSTLADATLLFEGAESGGVVDDVRSVAIFIDNTSPTANNDSYSVDQDGTLNIAAPGVLSNDNDPETDPVAVWDFTHPSNGSVNINADGSFSYTPDPGFNGADSFDYIATDGNDGTVHYWKLDGDATDSVGSSHGAITGTTTVAGHYGDALSFDETVDRVVVPDFAYTDEFTVSFRFKVDDISGSSYQYLFSHGTISTQNNLNINLGETGSSHAGILLTNFADSNDTPDAFALNVDLNSLIGDGQWHLYTLTASSTTGAKVYIDGLLENSDSSRGGDAFNPGTDLYLGAREDLNTSRFYGEELDSVQIHNRTLSGSEVSDLNTGGNARGTVSITVNPVNDNPTGAGSLTTTALNDNAGATNLFGGLTVSDVDVGENDLSLTITLSNPGAGTLSAGGFTETGAGTGIYTVGSLTVAQANTALDNVTFTPTNNTGPSGTFATNILVTVNDQGGGGEQSVLTATAVTITRVNDNPVFIGNAIGYWHFDEGAGDTTAEAAKGISDGTLGSNPGADANDPTWTAGRFGQALQFDGLNDYVEVVDDPGLDISGSEFSASLWMNPDAGPNTEDMLFMKGDRSGNINYYLSWKNSGEMTWAFKDGAGWHYQDMAVTLPTTGQWNHVTVVFDRPTVSLYVNGTKYVFDNVATGGSMDRDLTANGEPLWIGAGRDGGAIVAVNDWSGPFSGSIDDLALYGRALTDAEVDTIRNSGPPAATASAFTLNENSANNTVVGSVVATDRDVGDTFTYAITGGNTGGAFSIDSNGQIRVANSAEIDFETNPVFNLTVEATDSGTPGLTGSTTVTVSLVDVNDNPTGAGSLTTASLNDNAGATNLFSGLTVSDVDAGENDLALTITLSNPGAGSLSGGGFTETGAGTGIYTIGSLTVAQANTALDNVTFTPTNNTGPSGTFATNISVTVNDQGGGGEQSVLAATTVTITRVNDNPTATANANTVTEDTALVASGNVLTDDDGAGLDSDVDTGDTLTVTEVDGETIPANDVTGSYGSLNWDTDGSYTYTLDNLNPAVQALNFGATLTDIFTYTLSDANAGTSTANLTITIQGRDDVSFAVNSTAAVSEAGPTAATFTVTLGGTVSAGNTASVDITAGGSATDGSDYSPAFATALSSAAASTTAVTLAGNTLTFDNTFVGPNFAFTVNAQDDGLFEPTETITATLSGASTANGAATIGTAATSTDLTDNDTRPTISIANASLVEGDAGSANLNFTVTRTGDAEANQTFNYSFADISTEAGDFNHTGGSIVFAQGENSKTITVAVNGDTLFEGDETFTVTAVDAADAGNTASATGTVTDNETRPTIGIANAALVEGDAGSANLTFTVTRTGDAEADQTFNYSFTDISTAAGDFNHTAGNLVFAQGENSKTLTVAVNGDTLFEADETFTVTAVDAADGTNTASATGTITDNETATANLALTTHGQEAGPVDALFTVTLDKTNDTGAAISFDLTAPGGTATEGAGNDYLLPGGAQITVAAGAASGTYTLSVNDDALLEGTETVQVQIANPSDGDVTIGTATATANIADDDGASVAINDISLNEAAGTATLTVTLSGNVPGGFTVDYASSDGSATAGSDYTAASGTLNFTGNNTETQTIVVAITDDGLVEASETLDVTLSNLSNGLVTFSDDTGQITITDNDSAQLSIAANDPSAAEPADNGQFTVTLSQAASTDTTLSYTVTGTATPGAGNDYTALPGSVTIAAGATTATLDVSVLDDALLEASETVILTLNSITSGDSEISIGATNSATVSITDDEAPTATVAATDASAAEAGTDPGQFTVDLGTVNNTGSAVTVSYSVAGTATAGADYTALAGSVTVANGAQTATIDVTGILDEALVEANETVTVTLTGTDNGAVGVNATPATVTIADNDSAQLAIAANDASAAEPADNGQFTVTLSQAASTDTTVSYTVTGTATPGAGNDYSALPGSVTLAAGATTATLDVSVLDDALLEASETVIVTLSSITSGDSEISIGAGNSATVTLNDNETATATVAANDSSAAEAGSDPGQFTVDLGTVNHTGSPITVNYSVGGTATAGGDYTALSGSVTVADGQQTATIAVGGILDDGLFEADETVTVTLTSTDNGAVGVNVTPATVTLTDNDTATANLALTTHGQEAGPVDALFTVTLDKTNDTGAAISFDLTAPGGTATEGAGNDYLLPGGAQITVAAGAASGTYTLSVNDDALLEGTETVQVQIANPSDGDVTIGTATATANIADDDGASVAINDISLNEAAGTATLTVTLSGNVPGGFTVDYASSDGSATAGSDYTAASGTLNFTGNNTETQTIVVAITDDGLVEASETLDVTLSNLSNGLVTFSDDTGQITITDNDSAQLSIAANDPSAAEPADNGQFTVTLSQAASTDTTLSYTVTGTATPGAGNDYTALPGSVTIAAGATTATLDVSVLDDALLEASETVILTLNSITSGDSEISVGASNSATVTLADNETATASVSATDASAAEAGTDPGQFTVDLGTVNHTGSAVTVSYSVAGTATAGTDYTALSGSVTVANGAQTATIDVTGILDEALVEANETVTVTLTGTDNGAVGVNATPATVTIADNDNAQLTIAANDASAAEPADNGQFTVTLSQAASTDTTVSYTVTGSATPGAGNDYTALPGSVTLAAGATTATLDVSVLDDALLEAVETVIVTLSSITSGDSEISVGASNSATVTLADNETATASVSATDASAAEAGTDPGQFTVDLGTVNHTGGAITVNYNVAGTATAGADYTTLTGSVQIADGQQTATIAVGGLVDDGLFEADETVIATLTGTDHGAVGVNATPATVTLADNDTATANLAVTTHGNEAGPVDALFTVTLDKTNDTGAAITFDLTAPGGTATEGAGNDYLLPGGAQITVAAGAASGTYTLTVNDDALVEGTETVQVQIANPSDPAVSIATATATANITDDDGASVAINDLTANEAAGTATLTVTLTGNVPGGFTVDYASSDGTASAGSDYTAASGTLNFTGTNTETRTITVTLTDDDWVEANETLNVVLSNLSNGLVSFSDDTGVVTLTNDDNTPVVTGGQTFTVGELAGNGTSLGSVAATDADGPTTFQSWSIVSGNAGGLFDINPATGELTVLDNTTLDFETLPTSYTLGITVSDGTNTSATQSVAVNVTDVPASITAGQVFAISEAAANGSAVRSVATTGDTPVNFAITAGNPGTAFAIDNAGNITVNNTNQLNFEGTSSYTLTLAVGDGSSNTSQTVTVNLTDANDAPVLDNSPAPTLTPITEDNLTNPGNQLSSLLGAWVTDEDAGAFEGIALTGLASGNGTWQFSTDGGGSWSNTGAVADNNALLLGDSHHIRFVPDGQNADSGSITYRAWDQSSGGAGTKVNASSNGGATAFSTASETAAISVTALNDAPTLTGASYSLDPSSPAGTALGAVAGSDVDTGDTLTYSITAGNTGGTFAIDPATGQLSVADSTGLTDGAGFNLTVQVQDSGAPVLSDTAAVTIQVNTPPAVEPPPVEPPPVEPPPEPVIEPPPTIEPPPVFDPAPPTDTGKSDEPEPEEETRSPAGGGTAQPNTPTESSPLFGEEAQPAASPLTGVDELRYGDRDRSRPHLTARPDLYDGPPPVQLQQVVAAAEPIELPEMQEPALWGALDMMAAQMNDAEEWRAQERERQVTLQATTGVAFTLSAGFVTWLLRAGTLASSLLSSMPLWRGFDPLPVVGFTTREHKRLKAAARRLHKDEAQAHPDVERLFDRASEPDPKPKKKVRRKGKLKGRRRTAPAPSS